MSAREAILSAVRAALGRGVAQPPEAPPAPRIRIPETSVEARIDAFSAALGRLAGRTILAASPGDARHYVSDVIGGKPSVASNASFLRTCEIDRLGPVQTGFTEESALRAACAAAAFGITSADYALADTGTLVMLSSPEEARMISLLPPVHLAVVPRERILTGLDELFSILPQPGNMTSSMVLITGPSRTADIEQILVRGVHGPGEIHAIVV
ncbi:MAG TPA: lactate utilization protein [Bryobacteraceae bacterium]|nr:lactate utilization protein [Bryobacteraceae bacterium]